MLLSCKKLFKKQTKRGLELVSLPHLKHDFWGKIILTSFFIKWLNFIAWLTLLLEILGNMCTAIICCPVCDVINFQTNLSLLIKPFFLINKKSKQIYKYLKNEKNFQHEIESIFHHFFQGFKLPEIVVDPRVCLQLLT